VFHGGTNQKSDLSSEALAKEEAPPSHEATAGEAKYVNYAVDDSL